MNSLEFTKNTTKLSEHHLSESKNVQVTEGNAVSPQNQNNESRSEQLVQSSGEVADDGGELDEDGVVVRTSVDVTPLNHGSIPTSVNNQSDGMQKSIITSKQAD